MQYWEIVADKLSAAGFSWGYCSAVTPDGWRWIVDAHSGDGRRYDDLKFRWEWDLPASSKRRKMHPVGGQGKGDCFHVHTRRLTGQRERGR